MGGTTPGELSGPRGDGESEPASWVRNSEAIEPSVPCFSSKGSRKPFSESRDTLAVSSDSPACEFRGRGDRIADRKEGPDGWGWDCVTVRLESMDELGSRSSVVDVFARDSESGDIELFSRGMNSPFCQLDSMRFIEGNPDSVAAAETDDFPESAKCWRTSEGAESNGKSLAPVAGDSIARRGVGWGVKIF